VKKEPDTPPRKRPVTGSNAGISIHEPATQHPRGRIHLCRPKEEIGDEPSLLAAARRQQQLCIAKDPKDSPGYLKPLLDSMNDHRSWVANRHRAVHARVKPLTNFTGGEGSSSASGQAW
jgi:hypothetical protein